MASNKGLDNEKGYRPWKFYRMCGFLVGFFRKMDYCGFAGGYWMDIIVTF